MTRPACLCDSITLRFALAIGGSAVVCMLLNALLDALIGGPLFPRPGVDPVNEVSQWLLRSGILLATIIAVSLLNASRLARPIEAFTAAARRFGADPNARPLQPQGPAELQTAIIAFNAMQSQIQSFVTGQAAMFAAISHDLRTPLTRMRLRGEFIEDSEQQARLFRDIDKMHAMVNAVLMFLRDNAADEATTSLDLAELLRSITDDYADAGSDVTYTGPQHLAFPGRPIGLRRAFGNLVDNAVKYGVQPGIMVTHGHGDVTVTISDQGPGIPPAALEAVFTPFQRLEASRNRHTGGMGLGLTAARAGFRAHGGDVVAGQWGRRVDCERRWCCRSRFKAKQKLSSCRCQPHARAPAHRPTEPLQRIKVFWFFFIVPKARLRHDKEPLPYFL